MSTKLQEFRIARYRDCERSSATYQFEQGVAEFAEIGYRLHSWQTVAIGESGWLSIVAVFRLASTKGPLTS